MNLIGPNWKTTLSGIGAALFSVLTILAALPYETGGISDIFGAWKPKILAAAAAAAFILKVWNSVAQKSANVTGGNVQQTLEGNFVEPGKQNLVDATLEASPAEEKKAARADAKEAKES